MHQGQLSSRAGKPGDRHHLWNNNGTFWVHYTLHFGFRKRRIRRSLRTRSVEEAIRRRDELFTRIARGGEWVEERGDGGRANASPALRRRTTLPTDSACLRQKPSDSSSPKGASP
jgi:hypothetical protein